jgi:hypothetical protein
LIRYSDGSQGQRFFPEVALQRAPSALSASEHAPTTIASTSSTWFVRRGHLDLAWLRLLPGVARHSHPSRRRASRPAATSAFTSSGERVEASTLNYPAICGSHTRGRRRLSAMGRVGGRPAAGSEPGKGGWPVARLITVAPRAVPNQCNSAHFPQRRALMLS